MKRQSAPGYSVVVSRRIPKSTHERWSFFLATRNIKIQDRVAELIENDLEENWNEELEEAYKEAYLGKEE